MKLPSRSEELMLLAVWRLQENAYAVTIREQVNRVTGKTWSFGTIFVTLDRLSKKGYLTSELGEPTPERGGRSKRFYRLTQAGRIALLDIRRLEQSMWEGISELALQGGSP